MRLAVALAGLPTFIARRPVLLFLVTLGFVLAATLSLALSGLVFQGWWQAFCLELGVGLLIAGFVDVAILGALHGLIEGDGNRTKAANIQIRLSERSVLVSHSKRATAASQPPSDLGRTKRGSILCHCAHLSQVMRVAAYDLQSRELGC